MVPGEEIVDDCLGDQLLAEQHPQHLGAEEPLDVLGVEPSQGSEGAVWREAAVGDEHVDVGVEVEQLPGRLQEPCGARR